MLPIKRFLCPYPPEIPPYILDADHQVLQAATHFQNICDGAGASLNRQHQHLPTKTQKCKNALVCLQDLDQGLFCHDQVSSGKFLAFFNL